MKKYIGIFLAAIFAVSLVGCVRESNLTEEYRRKLSVAQVEHARIGNPLQIDNCAVTLYRVSFAGDQAPMDATVAIADCPSSVVTSEHSRVGKSGEATGLTIKPKEKADIPTSVQTGEKARNAELQQEIAQLKKALEALSEKVSKNP